MSARATGRPMLVVAMIAIVGSAPALGAQDAAARPRAWDARLTVGRVEHRVDAGFGVGTTRGTAIGVAARVRRWAPVELDAHAWGGQLDADEVARDDRTVGEVGVRAAVPAMPWLALVGSATLRGVDAAPAVQRWTQLGVGTELRFGFADGMLQSVVRTELMPRVAVSGGASPDLGVGGGAGLRLEHRWLQASLEYSVERYGFPSEAGGTARREQLSGLQLGVGARW